MCKNQGKYKRVTISINTEIFDKLEKKAVENGLRLSKYLEADIEAKFSQGWDSLMESDKFLINEAKMINALVWQFIKKDCGEESAKDILENAKELKKVNMDIIKKGLGRFKL